MSKFDNEILEASKKLVTHFLEQKKIKDIAENLYSRENLDDLFFYIVNRAMWEGVAIARFAMERALNEL